MSAIYFSFFSIIIYIIQEITFGKKAFSFSIALIPLGIYLFQKDFNSSIIPITLGIYWGLFCLDWITRRMEYKLKDMSLKPVLFSWMIILGERIESLTYLFVYFTGLILFSTLYNLKRNIDLKELVKTNNDKFLKILLLLAFIFLGVLGTNSIDIFANNLHGNIISMQFGFGLLLLLLLSGVFESLTNIRLLNKSDNLIPRFIQYFLLPISLTSILKIGVNQINLWDQSILITILALVFSSFIYLYQIYIKGNLLEKTHYYISLNSLSISLIYLINSGSSIEYYIIQMALNLGIGYIALDERVRCILSRKLLAICLFSFPLSPLFFYKFTSLREITTNAPLYFTCLFSILMFIPLLFTLSFIEVENGRD